MKRLCAVALLALLALGCGGRGDRWDDPLVVEGPVVAADRLAFLDRTLGRLVIVDDEGAAKTTDLPRRAHGLSSHGDEFLLLAPTPSGGELVTVGPGGTSVVPVPRDFDRVHVAPSGAVAVLTYDTRPVDGPLVRDLNEVAVVDRATGTSTLVSLSTGALAPRQVLFSPDETLAAILLDDAVALIELAPPHRRIQLPLGLQGSGRLQPKKGLFSPDGTRLFLLTEGADDVVAIEVLHDGGAFDATINLLFLPGARGLRDIAVVPDLGDGVVALWDQDAAFLDGRGDASRTLATAVPQGLDTIADLGGGLLFFYGASGALAAWAPREVLFGSDHLPGRLLAQPQVVGATVALPHAGPRGEPALSLVTVVREDIRLRLVTKPFGLSGRPIATAKDEDGRVFVALQIPRPGSDGWSFTGGVVSIDATTGATEGATLDEAIASFGVVGGSVFAVHPSVLGDLTLLPRQSVVRKSAQRLDGFLATGMMEGSP